VFVVTSAACVQVPDRDLRLVDAGGPPDAERAPDAVRPLNDTGLPNDSGTRPDAARPSDAALQPGDEGLGADAVSVSDASNGVDGQPAADAIADAEHAQDATGGAEVPDGFLLIQSGEFTMGTPGFMEPCPQLNCETPHRVRITRDFYIGKTEVTVGEWNAVMPPPARTPLAGCGGGDRCPVTNVTWQDAVDYCIARSLRENKPNCFAGDPPSPRLGCGGYRLPTEAEWEYVARGGTTGARWNEQQPTSEVAWYGDGVNNALHIVGDRPPNPFGLTDVYGNANEWVHDWLVADYGGIDGTVIDPLGGAEENGRGVRVVRGGGFRTALSNVRSAYRGAVTGVATTDAVGFRVVLGLPAP
jgi:sulfatase modifying factor 1